MIDYMIKAGSVKVSILMPVFNAEHTLYACLESILAQTVHDYEVIAVNDFSTDSSVGLMRAYKDARILFFDNRSKGVVSTLKAGIAHCQSDIVARMGADDVMYPEYLEKQLNVLHANPEITLCARQVRKFPEEMVRAGYVMGEDYLDVA